MIPLLIILFIIIALIGYFKIMPRRIETNLGTLIIKGNGVYLNGEYYRTAPLLRKGDVVLLCNRHTGSYEICEITIADPPVFSNNSTLVDWEIIEIK